MKSPAILLLFLLIGFHAFGQQVYHVKRGERPPIDLHTLSPEAYVAGKIKIKFSDAASRAYGDIHATIGENGLLRFGISEVDALNEAYQVHGFAQTFDSPAFTNEFSDRHHAWGFHLWYDLYFDPSLSIVEMVAAYEAFDYIEVAEPEYKKQLIGNVSPAASSGETSMNDGSILRWTPDDPQLDQQWHYHNTGQQNGTEGADIQLFDAWEIEKGSVDVIVAIVDDGIQFTHPDLAGNMWEGIGYNFVNNSANISPGDHGTHVAGTVAAVTNNEVGVAGVAGGSGFDDGVRLMSAQVFSGFSSGGFHLAPVYAADNGAAISQNSWGYTAPNVYDQNVLDAIDYFNMNGGGDALLNGGITIFAAGNDNEDAPYYPGYYEGVFSVAATNNQDMKSWYSTYGDWIDISAPGGETNTVTQRGVLSTLTNNSYGFFQGTSMACPHASGVAALVISLAYGELSNEELADIMRNTTDDHYALNPGFIGKLGTGRLNAHSALLEAQSYIDGVRNPAGFSAMGIDIASVELNWVRNADDNPVVIAWSDTSSFGIPAAGESYSAGDTLADGGIILYSGADTNLFVQEGLEPASMYFYRIWSYDDTLAYSIGRSASALTACDWFDLPFAEGFEESPAMPLCWSQETIEGGLSWTVGSGNGESNPSSAFEGERNIYLRSNDFFASGLTTRLVSPQLNLSQTDSAQLSFHYTNPELTFLIFSFQDVLHLKYKNAWDADWVTLATFDSDTPNWTEFMIDLPELSNDYYIAFEGVANAGYGIAIDAISIEGTQLAGFYIQAEAGANGSIEPAGEVFVPIGEDQSFEIIADTGFHIESLMVDNTAITEAEGEKTFNYTFSDVNTAHSIMATFAADAYDLQLTVVPLLGGLLSYEGALLHGQPITLTAEPNPDYAFSHWAENGDTLSAENPFSFVLLGDREIEGHFMLTTGISASAESQVKIWPNPVRGQLFVEFPKQARLEIFNKEGKLVHSSTNNAGIKHLDVSHLSAGVYVLHLISAQHLSRHKIIIL